MSIVFEHKTEVENTIEEAFAWHERKGAFRRLMPPWELAEEVRADDNLKEGSQRIFRFPMGPIKMNWVAQHTGYNPPHSFEDKMLKGPFKSWHHTHKFKQVDGGVEISDRVIYSIPMGIIGRVLHFIWIKRDLEKIFSHRKKVIEDILVNKNSVEKNDFERNA